MPLYKSHKQVTAFKILGIAPPDEAGDKKHAVDLEDGPKDFRVSKEWYEKHEPENGGYLVIYEDGYQSFSPAEAFEQGYTRLDIEFTGLRVLNSHIVNPCNDKIDLLVMDGPGAGGASHHYRAQWPTIDGKIQYAEIKFQNGPIKENGTNGLTHEVLLAILEDRLASFQAGPYKCNENEIALSHVRGAQQTLQNRTRARQDRGVEGTMAV